MMFVVNWQKKLKDIFFRVKTFWYWVFKEFFLEKGIERSSALTLSTLLAIVPLLIVVLMVISIIPGIEGYQQQIEDFIINNFVPSTGKELGHYIKQLTHHRIGMPVMAIAGLFGISILMISSIDKAMNDIWKVEKKRPLRQAFLLYWTCLTLGPILLGMGLFISSYITSMRIVHQFDFASNYVIAILPFCFNLVAFTFLYKVLPYKKVNFFHALQGALFAALVFELAKKGFTLYITTMPTYQLIYGSLATIPIFILWVYISWVIFFLGALLVNGLYMGQARRHHYKINDFILALSLINYMHQAQKNNQIASLNTLLKQEKYVSLYDIKRVLNRLCEKKFVYGTDEGEYVLTFNLSETRLSYFYKQLGFFIPIDLAHPESYRFQSLRKVCQQVNADLAISISDILENTD